MAAGSRSGFTLFEVVVTAVILSVGMVAIYEALAVSVDAFGYYRNRLTVQSWMDRKIWEVGDALMQTEGGPIGSQTDTFRSDGKDIRFHLTPRTVIDGKLYELNLKCSWRQGRRNVSVSRVAYAAI